MSLGDVLLEHGVVDARGLAAAADHHERTGVALGRALVDLGLASEDGILMAVAAQLGVPFLAGGPGEVDPDAAAMLPRDVAEAHTVLPVAFHGDGLLVAISDPANTAAIDAVGAHTNLATYGALMPRAALAAAIAHLAEPVEALGTDPVAVEDLVRAAAPASAASAASVWDVPEAVELEPPAPPPGPTSDLAYEQEIAIDLDALLTDMVERGGSDLHLTAGIQPCMRLHGELEPMREHPVATPDELRKVIYGILSQKQREVFENELELDISYAIRDVARFRVNVFQQKDSIGAVMRTIPFEILPIEKLGVPSQVSSFAYLPRGFVLVTGPTGSGKSTTLASVIDVVNRERAAHVMTIEDPIEFLHTHKRSVVNQRELGQDTHGFAAALKHVLRQDPDVILVGEMRDLETIQVALTAAETGHLVFGTLHTQDAPQTIDRVIDVFPPHQQEQIRVQLAGALQGVVCQQLLKTADGQGRTVACEVMIATPAIRNLIREGKTHQMYSSIQSGKNQGMITMDQSLANLVTAGRVTYDAALERCANVADLNRLCGRA